MFDEFIKTSNKLLAQNRDSFDLLRWAGTLSIQKNPSYLELNNPKHILALNSGSIIVAETKIAREINKNIIEKVFGSYEEQGEISSIHTDIDQKYLALVYSLPDKFTILIYSLATTKIEFEIKNMEGIVKKIFWQDISNIIVIRNQNGLNDIFNFSQDEYKNKKILKEHKGQDYILDKTRLIYIDTNIYSIDLVSLNRELKIEAIKYSNYASQFEFIKETKDYYLVMDSNRLFILFNKNFQKTYASSLSTFSTFRSYIFKTNIYTNSLYIVHKVWYALNENSAIIIHQYNLDNKFKNEQEFKIEEGVKKITFNKNNELCYLSNNNLVMTNGKKNIIDLKIKIDFNIDEVGIYDSSIILKDKVSAYEFNLKDIKSSNPQIRRDKKYLNFYILYGKTDLDKFVSVFKDSKNLLEFFKNIYNIIQQKVTSSKYKYIPVPKDNGDIELYENNSLVSTLIGHNSNINSIDFYNNLMLSADINGEIKIWNLKNIAKETQPSLNLYFYGGEWVIWLNQEYYLYSNGAKDLYGFNITTISGKSKFYSFQKFEQDYDRAKSKIEISKAIDKILEF
jgi:hypothetical protein